MATASEGAVRRYQDHPLRVARGKLERRFAELSGALVSASDWADFKKRLGRIEGLKEAMDIIEDVEKENG